jgi:hypothetical protein
MNRYRKSFESLDNSLFRMHCSLATDRTGQFGWTGQLLADSLLNENPLPRSTTLGRSTLGWFEVGEGKTQLKRPAETAEMRR